jgi:hypothetical protein
MRGFTVYIVFRVLTLKYILNIFCARFKMDDSGLEDDRDCEGLEDVQMHGTVPNPGENVLLEAEKRMAKNNKKQKRCRAQKAQRALESNASRVAEEAPAVQRACNGPKKCIESFDRRVHQVTAQVSRQIVLFALNEIKGFELNVQKIILEKIVGYSMLQSSSLSTLGV